MQCEHVNLVLFSKESPCHALRWGQGGKGEEHIFAWDAICHYLRQKRYKHTRIW